MNQDLYLHGLIKAVSEPLSEPIVWERPLDWLAVPDLVNGTHKIYMLLSIVEGVDNNVASLNCSGEYTVDWGDESVPQVITGAATHTYDWADIDVGTVTSEGRRQVLVTATATTTFTSININQTLFNAKIQELKINAPLCTSLTIADNATNIIIGQNSVPDWSSFFTYNSQMRNMSLLHTDSLCTNFSSMFYNTNILSVTELNIASGTDFSSMFGDCYSLRHVPIFNTSLGTNFFRMFYQNYALKTIPLLNTSSGTNFSNMFRYCYSLSSIPLLDTSSGTNFNTMFSGCWGLTTIPLLDTSSGTNFNTMFADCTALQSIPLIDTSSGTNFSYMFNYCSGLIEVPVLNTSAGTNFNAMFRSCQSLLSAPTLNTSSGTNFDRMYGSCHSITHIPSMNVSLGTNFNGMFEYCNGLVSIELLDFTSGTTVQNPFIGCAALKSLNITNIPTNQISVSSSFLDRNQILNIFNELATGTGVCYLSPESFVLLSGPDIAIATGKGWTVTS